MITFHRANNIGANLQAFALNKYINENIGHCEIIDFVPNNQVDNRNIVLRTLSLAKRMVFGGFDAKNKRFAKFKKNYKLSQKSYKGDKEMFANPPQYDVLVSGSDQILNATISGNSKSFYLAFCHDIKKISYASSFGRKDISKAEEQLIEGELPKFATVSCREQSGVDTIKELTGIDATLVLDPVFLMTGDEWRSYKTRIKAPEKYIFVYAMQITDQIKNAIQKAKEQLGIPVLVVYGGLGRGLDGKEVKNCGPAEFLSYIDGAELVITNSFHGTALSVIFKKDLLCVAHSTRNARLENILTLCSSADKLITKDQEILYDEMVVKGEDAEKAISPYVEVSKQYLLENCKM